MNNDDLTPQEMELSKKAATQLGLRKCLVYQDGQWFCDPRDSRHPNLPIGCGGTLEEAIEDCRIKRI